LARPLSWPPAAGSAVPSLVVVLGVPWAGIADMMRSRREGVCRGPHHRRRLLNDSTRVSFNIFWISRAGWAMMGE
jgi:hypothetical protein